MTAHRKKSGKKANPMWGGHFTRAPAEAMAAINPSIAVDKALYAQDIAASIVHAQMLAKQKIISISDAKAIERGLRQIEKEIASGKFVFRVELEDIHMNIESRLTQIIGEAAGRLHTARSRNDQAATGFRLYVRDAIDATVAKLGELQEAFLDRAEEHAASLMPGFTHLQTAQPITLGHHLMAYVEMFARDAERLTDARKRLNESPLGACALAGTSFPIDRNATAKSLGFSAPMRNSLDSVSSRDFALEFLSAASICAVNLSRLAEEFILWSSRQFGYIALSEAFTSGSSIMPQKRNPDAAELVRGKAGRIIGNLASLLVTMKGLPLAYNKDMQEDKKPLMDAAEELSLCIAATTDMVRDFTANTHRMAEDAASGYSTATDLADWLVRKLNIPFRSAHHITGRIVTRAEKKKLALHALPLAEFQAEEKRITKEIFSVLSAKNSVASRASFGGTAPQEVRKAIRNARKRLA